MKWWMWLSLGMVLGPLMVCLVLCLLEWVGLSVVGLFEGDSPDNCDRDLWDS